MGIFVKITIDGETCIGSEVCGKCVDVCPVSIFKPHTGVPIIAPEYEDECILCNVCLESCEPSAISIQKLYET